MAAAEHTVLVVDDDAALRLLCRVNLELDGYRVLEAADLGAAQAALAAAQAVDVVLLDVHLGSEDGRELLGDLEAPGSPRVALFTGSAEVDEGTRARADAVLRKPFTLGELSEVVERLSAAGIA